MESTDPHATLQAPQTFNIISSQLTNLAGSGSINYNEAANQTDNQKNLSNTQTTLPVSSAKESSARKILILAANPKNTSQLRLDEEVREIDAGLQRNQQQTKFILEQKWAVRPRDVQRAMLDFKPQFVHFSGHSHEEAGLALEDKLGKTKLVNGSALAGLFELFADQVECVVLNACYSEGQAEAIAQHIPFVIGMDKAIGDSAAIEFAVGFYDALGAGESVEFAYKLGCNAIRMAGISEYMTPVLKKKSA